MAQLLTTVPPITIALLHEEGGQQISLIDELINHPAVNEILLMKDDLEDYSTARLKTRWVLGDSFYSCQGIYKILSETASKYILYILPGHSVRLGGNSLNRLLQIAEDTGAGLVYSDFRDEADGQVTDHPLIDYQLGSIRDSFDFIVAFVPSFRWVQSIGSQNWGMPWRWLAASIWTRCRWEVSIPAFSPGLKLRLAKET